MTGKLPLHEERLKLRKRKTAEGMKKRAARLFNSAALKTNFVFTVQLRPLGLVPFHGLKLADFFKELTLKGLLFSVLYRRRLLEVLAFLPLANDTLFLNHAFEPLEGLFEHFSFVYTYKGDTNHLPFFIK
jgi:hypothetical protein